MASTTLAVIEEDHRGVWSTDEKANPPVSELLSPSNDHCLPFDPFSETNLDSNTQGTSIQAVPSPLENEVIPRMC